MSRTCSCAVTILLAWTTSTSADDAAALSPAEIFEQRIMPIFRSPEPASCVQCHLSSVDLKDYIKPSYEQTFVSLRDQGLVDLSQPERSKILTLIRMGDADPDSNARRIHETMRKAEYEAFAEWIRACSRDERLRSLPPLELSELARPDRPDEVIRHARKSRVVDSFVRNIWSQRMRCFPCHTPHELDESNPRLAPAIERHKEFLAKLDPGDKDRLDIFRETPEATMQSLIEKSRNPKAGELPLINLEDPARSLLILKPTAKLPEKSSDGKVGRPSYSEPVSHLGGLKMHVDDQSYKSFIAWIADYARVAGDRYTSVADLPADNWFPSKHMILMREVPSEWAVGDRIQFLIYAQDEKADTWSEEPIAFTQGSVTPVRNVAGSLFVFGPGSDPRADLSDSENARLKPGRYLLKAYRDAALRLAKDPTRLLPQDDYVGELELDARWREGFANAEKPLGTDLIRK